MHLVDDFPRDAMTALGHICVLRGDARAYIIASVEYLEGPWPVGSGVLRALLHDRSAEELLARLVKLAKVRFPQDSLPDQIGKYSEVHSETLRAATELIAGSWRSTGSESLVAVYSPTWTASGSLQGVWSTTTVSELSALVDRLTLARDAASGIFDRVRLGFNPRTEAGR